MISDKGPQFASKFMGELYKCLGIQRTLSMAYHPQTNGQTEQMNQEIEAFLQHYVNYKQDDWANWIAEAEFQYNDKQHSTTGFSPFYLNYGRHPGKEMKIGQLLYPKYKSSHKNLRNLGGKPNKP